MHSIMKNILLSILSLLCSLHMPAQITVTSSTLPALGDTLRYAWAYNQATVAMVTPPSFDESSWDFTGLTPNAVYDEIYRAPGQGQNAARFPNANLLVINSSGERYYQVTPSGLYLLGHSENDLFGYPFNVVYQNTVPIKERYAPLNFFDVSSQSSFSSEGFRFAELPAGLQAAYNASGLVLDSIRLRIETIRSDVVDAYGTVVVPGPVPQPQYSVLRQKSTLYRGSFVDGKIPLIGWFPITDPTWQWVPGSHGRLSWDSSGTHIFFNDVTKEEIARITINNSENNGRPVHVRYKNNIPPACAIIDTRPQNIWTGSAGNNWENAANWSCGAVPGANTDVFVNSGTVVINSAIVIRSMQVSPGAQVTVGSGSLTLLH